MWVSIVIGLIALVVICIIASRKGILTIYNFILFVVSILVLIFARGALYVHETKLRTMHIPVLAIILAVGLIGFLIFFLFMERKTQKKPSLQSKTKTASSFAFGAGVFNILLAIISLVFKNKLEDIIPSLRNPLSAPFTLAYKYVGIYGVIGLFVLIGIACFVKARSLKRKSEQINKDRH